MLKPLYYYRFSIIGIILLLVTACVAAPITEPTSPSSNTTPTLLPLPSSTSAIETMMKIDGSFEDWAGRDMIGSDPIGDQYEGTPDISEVYGFSNDTYFYVFIKLKEEGTTDHYDIMLDIDGGSADHQVSVWPNMGTAAYAPFPVSGQMIPEEGVISRQGKDGIEAKIPLSLVGGKPIRTVMLQSFTQGSRADDFVDTMNAPIALEREPTNGPTPSSISAQPDLGNANADPCFRAEPDFSEGSKILDPNVSSELIWKAEFIPWWLRPGPDGKVLGITNFGNSIYEIKPDGSLEVFFDCPGQIIESFTYATDGALWFATRDGGKLFRVIGEDIKQITQNGNRYLAPGPNGSIFALENGLTRVDSDGALTKISGAVFGRHFTVSDDGTPYVVSHSSIVRVLPNGETEILADGYGPETFLTMGKKDELFATHWDFVHKIDKVTGMVTPYPFMDHAGLGESGIFAPDGRLILFHPNVNIFAVDLQTEEVQLFHHVMSNSWAMAVAPDGSVYVAFGNNQPNGNITVFRVEDKTTLTEIFSVPYGQERAMAFDEQGIGYLSVQDNQNGDDLISFDPATGNWSKLKKPNCSPGSITRDPSTGRMWMEDCGEIRTIPSEGSSLSLGNIPNSHQQQLAISPTGEFYQIAFFERSSSSSPLPRKLFRYESDEKGWIEVADLTQQDPAVTLATLTACPSGAIYTIESLGTETTGIGRTTFNAVRRLETDGSLTLLGYDFQFDGLTADCGWDDDDIYFTTGDGIVKVTVR